MRMPAITNNTSNYSWSSIPSLPLRDVTTLWVYKSCSSLRRSWGNRTSSWQFKKILDGDPLPPINSSAVPTPRDI
uniref:Uncharacterized protein n=1 Tax=Ditylenchus dipsaci TaxID=166011 RepID=A0A915DDY4_9BILA